jgi:hypothetical protein
MEEEHTMLDAPSFTIEEEGNDMSDMPKKEELAIAETEMLNDDDELLLGAIVASDTEEKDEEIEEEEIEFFEEIAAHPHAKKTKKQSKTSKWILYLSENRARVMVENPSCGFGEITKLIGEEYKKLSSEEVEALEKKVKEVNELVETAAGEKQEEEESLPKSATDLDLPLVAILDLFFRLFIVSLRQE